MDEKNKFALVPSPPSAVEKTEPGSKRVLSGMVTDTLTLARAAKERRDLDIAHRSAAAIEKLALLIRKAAAEGVVDTKLSTHWLAVELLGSIATSDSHRATVRLWMEADRHRWGRTVPKDYAEAVRLYRMAAEKGDAVGQQKLGECYMLGRGVEQDRAEGVKMFRKAAEQGNAKGQTYLGICFFNGDGISQDDAQAIKWFQAAAELGEAQAQNLLGICYARGRGVQKNVEQAFRWYRIASELGDKTAQFNLGVCYILGRGVAEDTVQAYKWLKLSAEQGLSKAKEKLSALSSAMSAAELTDGEKAYEQHSKRK